jgi:hypothetical protein
VGGWFLEVFRIPEFAFSMIDLALFFFKMAEFYNHAKA